MRSIVTESWDASALVIACFFLALCLQLLEVVVHAVEARFPDGPVLLRPGDDLGQRAGVESARPVLGELPA